MESEKLYLVLVRVNLVSGQTVVSVDAFRAGDPESATNMARNLFTQERGGVVVYGDHSLFSDSVCTVAANVIGVLDAEDKENKCWVDSVEIFDRLLVKEEQTASSM